MGGAGGAVGFVGRREDLAALRSVIDGAVAGRAGVLVVGGDAGVGKTALLAEVATLARAAGCRVLATCGREAEADIGYGALGEVVRPLFDLAGDLSPAQAAALRCAVGENDGEASVLTTYVATLLLVSAAAERSPVVVLVDDAHWLDRPSLRALLFVARRIGAERVGMVFAHRPDAELGRMVGDGLPEHGLVGLDGDAGAELARRLGVTDDGVARRCHELTGGNPLALVAGVAGLDEHQRAGTRELPAVLPLGRRLVAHFDVTLAGFPAATSRALGVAALDTSGRWSAVTATVRRRGGSAEDLGPAEHAGILAVTDDRLTWRHPLWRAAVQARLSPADRRATHAALADAARRRGDDEQALWHRAEAVAGPDDDVADDLERAGDRSRHRGAHASAGAAFERAAGLSTGRPEAARRLLLAAEAYLTGGHVDRTVGLARELPTVGDAADAARLALRIAEAELWTAGPQATVQRCRAHAAAVGSSDPDLASGLLLVAALAQLLAPHTDGALDDARGALDAAHRSGQTEALFAAAAMHDIVARLVGRRAVDGPPLDLAAVAGLAGAALVEAPYEPGIITIVQMCAYAQIVGEQHDAALASLDHVIHHGEAAGMIGRTSLAHVLRAEVLWRSGHWSASLAGLSQAVATQQATGLDAIAPLSLSVLARIEAGLGRSDGCRAHAAQCVDAGRRVGLGVPLALALSALGLLALGESDWATAAGALAQVVPLVPRANPGWMWWQADAVEALHRAGDHAAARHVLDGLEQDAAASPGRWAHGAVARCRALVGANADPDADEADLEVALAEFRAAGTPFEVARTLTQRGERHLQHGRPRDGARDLAEAQTLFDRLGARRWGERVARHRFPSRSDPPPLTASLTAAELRVALAIGQGATNRQAADQLQLSRKTVDYHLQNIYPKLGIRNRSQLTARVHAEQLPRQAAAR